ncbi:MULTISPECIES: DUF4105 domain-containing protein [Flavobacterium]|uniref:lipoprotein N-acyltransferase Lnb domain-containing protein n=1 Tax=Flavobacterium TaxID=237 RepID=UPI001FCA6860|nr:MULTISPECIES: DUF4105 domain-containing protein [Flavobacterium]UOK43803.1 DUF4105 domain-containing protein [Flavobacterium enshiense]
MIPHISSVRFFKYLLITFFFITSAGAQNAILSEKATVSLLTCGTGAELYSLYGHTALRINDPANNIDIVYNYGTFDFTTPNFYGKFVKGDLEYFVSTSSFEEFNYSYVYDDRDIFEQKLNLTQAQKQQIYAELGDVLASEKRFYTYKFIDRNCTTMVRDVINKVLPHPISTNVPDTQKKYRQILYDYQTDKFYENLGINLMFGAKTDKQCDQLFLPIELLQGIEQTKIDGKKLSGSTVTVFKSSQNGAQKSLWNNIYTFALALLVLAYLVYKKRKAAIVYLAVVGTMGLFFSLVGLYSLHQEILWNYNALLISPLFLPLVWLVLQKNTVWVNRLVLVSFGCIAIYLIYMLNKAHLIMMIPIVVTTSASLWKVRKTSV